MHVKKFTVTCHNGIFCDAVPFVIGIFYDADSLMTRDLLRRKILWILCDGIFGTGNGNFVELSSRLIFIGDQQNTITKVNLLNKVLGIVAGVLLIDHEVRKKDFQQVPYHRYRTYLGSYPSTYSTVRY